MSAKTNIPSSRSEVKIQDWVGGILKSKVFWVVLALKIIASFVFSGYIFVDSLIPFLEAFIVAPFSNVYETQWLSGSKQGFPYPAAMLWILSVPRLLIYWMGFHELNLNILMFIYRIPLIIADLLILIVLCRWMRRQITQLLWLYWASPPLFYITYLHGQFDVVPMALAFLSAYFLFSHRWLQSSIFLAIGIAAKMHLLLILPFSLIYLWQNGRWGKVTLSYSMIVCVGFLVINLFYIFSDGFAGLVLFNAEQSKVGLINLESNLVGINFYIIPAIILILVYYSFVIQIKNRDIFMFFMGASFGVFLLFIPPSQGWYYWFLPYLIYFYVRLTPTSILPLVCLQLAYFMYFALIPLSDFGALIYFPDNRYEEFFLYNHLVKIGLNASVFVGLGFTFLQTMLALNTFSMLYMGVHLKRKSKLRAGPFMIGISGASGAGKTTIADSIEGLIGNQHVGIICGDDMHKWERNHEKWSALTHLNPMANELHGEVDFIKRLSIGKPIWRRHYDHNTGQFTKERIIQSRSIMVLEGLHSFYLKPSRDLFDLKVFIKPDKALLHHRKIIRDMKKRGASKKDVIKSMEARAADQFKFIDTQERYADIVISTLPVKDIPKTDIGDPDAKIAERLQITLSNSYYMNQIISDLSDVVPGTVRHFYADEDRQVIELSHPPDSLIISALGAKHIEGLEFFGIYDPDWGDRWMAFLQFLICYCMFSDWEKR